MSWSGLVMVTRREGLVDASPYGSRWRVYVAAAVTTLAGVIELGFAHRAGSLFLVADALHLFAHLGIFIVLALPVSETRDSRQDIAASAILAIVLVIAFGITDDSIGGLKLPHRSPPASALVWSLAGLAANVVSFFLFRSPGRALFTFGAALVHELSDASLTIIALVGAGAIACFQWHGSIQGWRSASGSGSWSGCFGCSCAACG